MHCPLISVVMPVRNEAAHLRATLLQVLEQNYDPNRFEVLVADGRSSDGTPDLVRDLQMDWPNLRLLDNPRIWSSAGRNQALRVARGEIIVVIDGHCQLDGPNYLVELADAFRRSGADCVGRPQPLDVTGASPLQEAIAEARSSMLGHQPASFVYANEEAFVPPQSVAVAYRREVFREVGLFDESFDACEDVEFNHRVARAGLTCFFSPRVQAHYYPRSSLVGLFRQMSRYGRGRLRLFRKHPDTFSLACFLPALMLLCLVIGAVATWFSTGLALAYGLAMGIYALLVGAVSLAIAAHTGKTRLLAWLPCVFVAIHAGAGWGVLREWLTGPLRQPTRPLGFVGNWLARFRSPARVGKV